MLWSQRLMASGPEAKAAGSGGLAEAGEGTVTGTASEVAGSAAGPTADGPGDAVVAALGGRALGGRALGGRALGDALGAAGPVTDMGSVAVQVTSPQPAATERGEGPVPCGRRATTAPAATSRPASGPSHRTVPPGGLLPIAGPLFPAGKNVPTPRVHPSPSLKRSAR
jgi:hypothetical protein